MTNRGGLSGAVLRTGGPQYEQNIEQVMVSIYIVIFNGKVFTKPSQPS